MLLTVFLGPRKHPVFRREGFLTFSVKRSSLVMLCQDRAYVRFTGTNYPFERFTQEGHKLYLWKVIDSNVRHGTNQEELN